MIANLFALHSLRIIIMTYHRYLGFSVGELPEGPGCGVVFPVISACWMEGESGFAEAAFAVGEFVPVPGVLPPPFGVALPGLNPPGPGLY